MSIFLLADELIMIYFANRNFSIWLIMSCLQECQSTLLKLQGVQVSMPFSTSMSQALNLIKYYWSMTLFLPKSSMNIIFINNSEEFGQILWKFLIFHFILIEYCAYPWFWLLTFGFLVGHSIDFTIKFLFGKKIFHVWEEKESLINSIWWGKVPVRCWQKMR